MECPRRVEMMHPITQPPDSWRDDHTCSFCGSLDPVMFLEALENGEEVEPTDKNYKAYVKGKSKFYFQHLDEEQKLKFIDLLNSKKLNIAYPGRFYVLPFFIGKRSST